MTSALQGSAPGPATRREIVAWAFFDFANSSYTTVIVTVAFSVYFTRTVAPGPRADLLWGVGLFASNVLVLLTAPLIGAMADAWARKKTFLGLTTGLCVAGTASLAVVGPGDVGLGLVLFVVSNIGFSLGEGLIAAFLPEISTPATVGRISGFGWGLGYLGGLASLLLVLPMLGEGVPGGIRLAWPVTAVFFLAAALPTFAVLRERAVPASPRSALGHARAGLARLAATARAVRRLSELARFLAVFLVFSCGLTAVISFASIFAAVTLGFSPEQLIGLFAALQLSAAGGAVAFGALQDRIGARRTVQLTLVLWVVVCAAAAACRSQSMFWVVGAGAGIGLGSLQSASRALVALLAPVGKSGEIFGFWGVAGKAAYAIGPLAFGAASAVTGSQRAGVVLVGAFFLAGLVGMTWVDEARGRRQAAAWAARTG